MAGNMKNTIKKGMSDRPVFSICIPCFNHGQFIGQTIRSVISQQYSDFEILVADNASTDNSRDVVRSFKDHRIRLIENRYNIGYAPNLQQVTRLARGRYLNLLSSDDIMNSGTLTTYAAMIEQYKDSAERLVLMSQTWSIDGEGTVFQYRAKRADRFGPFRFRVPSVTEIEAQPDHEVFRGKDVFKQCMLHFETAGTFCSVVYSRELWESLEGYNSTHLINPDRHFMMKMLRTDPLVIYVNRPLYSYREHRMGQASQQARNKLLKVQVDGYNYLMEWDNNWLKGTGVSSEHQRRVFIERECLDVALVSLAEGQWLYASRLLAFAWATYPRSTLTLWKAWVLLFLLLAGPVGAAVTILGYSSYKWRQQMSSLSDMANSHASGRFEGEGSHGAAPSVVDFGVNYDEPRVSPHEN